jgi:hypothetical protein
MSDNNENKKVTDIIFAPGCFDNFDGTQEELDELINKIKSMVESGELFELATPMDIEDLYDETDPLEIEEIVNQMTSPRTLQ